MRCEQCGERLRPQEKQGRPAKFCSSRCRVAAHRRRHRPFPEEMTSRPRWVRHDDQKRPLTIFGHMASSISPGTWTTFAKASTSTVGVGIGFVLGDGIGCVDLDHCIVDGKVEPCAKEIVDAHRADAILIERSRSGEGVHIFLPMHEAPGRKIRDGRNIEIYSAGRYIAVTGDRL